MLFLYRIETVAVLEMEENQITLDNLEKGADNPAFCSVVSAPLPSCRGTGAAQGAPANVFQGEERVCEEYDGPYGETKEERRGEGKGKFSSYSR